MTSGLDLWREISSSIVDASGGSFECLMNVVAIGDIRLLGDIMWGLLLLWCDVLLVSD